MMRLSGARFIQESLKFVQGNLPQYVIIELSVAFTVEEEATHFVADLAAMGLVAVILRVARTELHDMVPRLQYVSEVTEVITARQSGLTKALREDHGIGVIVKHSVPQEIQGVIEMQRLK